MESAASEQVKAAAVVAQPAARARAEAEAEAERGAPPPYSAQRAEPPQLPPAPAPQPAHVTVVPNLGGAPRLLTCPSCRQPVITSVVYENSNKTHLLAGFVCGLTLWCFMCCVAVLPYYMKCAKVAEHYCPNCKTYIGGHSTL